MNKGVLYMIPCPIGEVNDPYDVLPAANREIIGSLDYFIVENIRSARRFLARAGAGKPIDSLRFGVLDEHTRPEEAEALLQPLLGGVSAGMISEAGVPGVADPGAMIAGLCHRHGVRVKPLVGPSSILLALMASGLNGQSFAVNGYLPVKPPERARALKFFERRARSDRQSQIFIEAPYRNMKLLEQILSVCSPETLLTVAADISSPAEYILTRSVGEWRSAPLPDIARRPAIFILQ